MHRKLCKPQRSHSRIKRRQFRFFTLLEPLLPALSFVSGGFFVRIRSSPVLLEEKMRQMEA
jgi:hypothetical protein